MPPAVEILYLDNHLLVVNKPPGMLVQGDRTGDLDLLSWGKGYLKERFDKPGAVFLGLVHRLDRPVSGVVVLARTSKAAARLSAQFRERSADKRYAAITEGGIKGEGTLIDYLVKRGRTVEIVPPEAEGARRAELRWRALAAVEVGARVFSLVGIELVTGRAHQIRVQLAALGHPIVGDFRYGAGHELDGRNIALHSHALTITHPTRREEMTFRAEPPASWRGYFEDILPDLLSDL